jgi:heme/copper-type cytochrome/quinol oxidase subunit 4
MEEESDALELREHMEHAVENAQGWRSYLALSTAIIAVLAAIASMLSGRHANQAIIEKNNAILNTSKASDIWNLYQSKGLKKNLDDAFFRQFGDSALAKEALRYKHEQDSIAIIAGDYERKAEESDKQSDSLMEHHHGLALSVTLFQIAIALSAISALLSQKIVWYCSLGIAVAGSILLLS